MKTCLIAGLFFCHLAGQAGAVVIDFESFPGLDGQLGTMDDVPIIAPFTFVDQPQQITTQYSSLGIEFLPDPPMDDKCEIVNNSSFFQTAGSNRNLLSTARGLFPFGPIEARFTAPVYELSMAIGLGGATSVRPNRLEIFDANNVLLDSVVASDAVVTLSSATPIARMLVTATLESNQAAIDDIEFTVVPEPISASILAPAALAGGWIARRRRPS